MIKEVTVLGQRFQVKYVTKDTIKYKVDGAHGDLYYGHMDPVTRCIYINRDLRGDQLKRVILHEMAHAYLRLAGLNEFMQYKLEEAICTILENQLDLFQTSKFTEFMNHKKPEEGIQ